MRLQKNDPMTITTTAPISIRLIAAWTVMFSVCLAEEKPAKGDNVKVEAAKEKSSRKPDPAVLSGAPVPADATQGLGAFGMLLPLGQKNLDVKIPSFKDGLPSSLIRAGSMTRLDDEYMEMEKLDIRLFGQIREKDVRVQLVTGEYHMPTQMLSSEQRSRISREDFQLEGDTLIFDTVTQQGKMVGNVQMVIFDSSSFTGEQAPKESKPEAEVTPEKPTDETLKKEPKDNKANDKK